MDHPNIAKVYDGGSTPAGHPYFVMELVKGVPITEFCDQNHLTPRQRLELFVSACEAVQHAHQKGIIHRDIKPSNVLVSVSDARPVVKVIDFGVAKALGQELTDKTLFTGFAQMIGTPLYMSPEQAGQSLDIDTRSDIYSLGVLLYELLTGTTPFTKQRFQQAAYDEIRRIIREEEPPRPSTRLSESKDSLPSISALRHTEPARLTKLLRGELDWVVMKALEKDRNRRYETANGFARDLQRYLADEPVQACPPSAWYRFRKFARRHRQAVAVGLVLVLAVLSTLVVLAVSNTLIAWERAEAVRQRNQAQDNFRMAKEAIDSFFTKVSESDLFDQPGAQPLRRQLLEDAQKFHERMLQQQPGDPEHRAELGATYFRLWQIYQVSNRFADSQAALRKGTEIAEQLYRERPDDLDLFKRLAAFRLGGLILHSEFLMPREAVVSPLYPQAARIWESLVERYPREPAFRLALAEMYGQLANLWRQEAGPRTRALALSRKAYGLYEQVAAANPAVLEYQERLVNARFYQGYYLWAVGRLGEAEKAVRRALDSAERMSAQFPQAVRYRITAARAHQTLFELYLVAHRYADADRAYSQAKAAFERLLRAFPKSLGYLQHIMTCHYKRTQLFLERGKWEEAEREARQGLVLGEKLVAAFPGQVYDGHLARFHMLLANIHRATGRSDEVVRSCRDAVAVYDRIDAGRFPMDDDWTNGCSDAYRQLIAALRARGENAQAEHTARLAVDYFEKLANAQGDPLVQTELAKWYWQLSKLLRAGKSQEAQQCRAQALAAAQRLLNAQPDSDAGRWALTHSQRNLAAAFGSDPQLMNEAAALYRQALATLQKLAAGNPAVPNYQVDAGDTARDLWFLEGAGRAANAPAAIEVSLRCFEKLTAEFPEEHYYWFLRGVADKELRRYDQAVADFSRALELRPKNRDIWRWRAGAYEALNQKDKALADLASATAWEPVDATDFRTRAEAYRGLHQYDKAVADLSRAIELDPTVTEYYRARAASYAELRRHDQAFADLTRIIELDPGNAASWIARGQAYRNHHDYDKALADFNKAIALDPKNASAFNDRGWTYRDAGQQDKALADYNRATELDPTFFVAWVLRAITYRERGAYDKALAELSRAIELQPNTTWGWHERAETYRQRKQYDQALADMNRAIQLDPTNAYYYRVRAASYADLHRHEQAFADLSRAIKLDPGNAASWIARGEAYHHHHDFDKALADFNKAIALDPKSASTFNARGWTYRDAGQLDKALADFTRSVELDPKNVVPWILRGVTYRDRGVLDRSLADLDKAVALEPNMSWGWYERAETYRQRKQYDRALADMNRTVELVPNDAPTRDRRGLIYKERHEYDKALADFSKSIDLNPKSAYARNERAWILGELRNEAVAAARLHVQRSQWKDAAAAYARVDWSGPLADDAFEYACLFLVRGDKAGYDRFCRQMTRRAARTKDPAELYVLARTCAMTPQAVVDPAQAVGWADRALAGSRVPWFLHALGMARYRAGQLDGALHSFQEALASGWNYRDFCWLGLALVHQRLGHATEARQSLAKASQWLDQLTSPNANEPVRMPPSEWLAVQLLLRELEPLMLADCSRDIDRNPKNADAWNDRAGVHLSLRHYAGAIEDYSKAIRLQPTKAAFHGNRGAAHARMGRQDLALADYSRAIELDARHLPARRARADAYFRAGDWARAAEDLGKIVELEPADVGAWYRRGFAYVNLNRWDKALADFDKVVQLAPKSAEAHNNFAWFLATCPQAKLRNPRRAVQLAGKAVELAPQEGNYFNTLGAAHYRSGDWKAAITALEKSRTIRQGGDAFDFFLLAMAHWQLGQKDDARKWYRQALGWVEKNRQALATNPQWTDELRRFQAETEELLLRKKN
jgi:tetratricopeptide (TPR) repeat protein